MGSLGDELDAVNLRANVLIHYDPLFRKDVSGCDSKLGIRDSTGQIGPVAEKQTR